MEAMRGFAAAMLILARQPVPPSLLPVPVQALCSSYTCGANYQADAIKTSTSCLAAGCDAATCCLPTVSDSRARAPSWWYTGSGHTFAAADNHLLASLMLRNVADLPHGTRQHAHKCWCPE